MTNVPSIKWLLMKGPKGIKGMLIVITRVPMFAWLIMKGAKVI